MSTIHAIASLLEAECTPRRVSQSSFEPSAPDLLTALVTASWLLRLGLLTGYMPRYGHSGERSVDGGAGRALQPAAGHFSSVSDCREGIRW